MASGLIPPTQDSLPHGLQLLEFATVLDTIASHASSVGGADHVKRLRPTADPALARQRLVLTDEMVTLVLRHDWSPPGIPDALPGLLRLAGYSNLQLPDKPSRLAKTVTGQSDWTQFIFGKFEIRHGASYFRPIRYNSRLKSMAEAEGIISIPEGTDRIAAGTEIRVSLVN